MYTMRPLTTSMNKPSVTRIAGSDSTITIGLSNELASDSTKPANTKVVLVASVSPKPPPSNRLAIHRPTVLSSQRSKKTANCFRISLCIIPYLDDVRRETSREISVSIFSNKDIILDSYTDTFLTDIDTRFYRHNHAWLECIVPNERIVHVHAQSMA